MTFYLGGGNFILAVAALSAATVGAVVASRRARHRVGWLLVVLGLSIAASGFVFSYTRYGLVARPGALPAAGYLAGFASGGVFAYLSCTGFVLLLTPTGSLPSPRWRWWPGSGGRAVVAFLSSCCTPAPVPGVPGDREPDRRRRPGGGPPSALSCSRPAGPVGAVVGPCRCCCGSGAPAGWSGCSCGG